MLVRGADLGRVRDAQRVEADLPPLDGGRVSKQSRASTQEGPPHEATVARPIQDVLGERLRAMYDQVRAEPIPDRFVELLERLEKPPQSDLDA